MMFTKRNAAVDLPGSRSGAEHEDNRDLLSSNRTYHVAQSRMELLPGYYAWLYDGLKPYIGGTVVELGCGSGIGIAHYVGRTEKVIAVDYNDELLNWVSLRYGAAPVEARKVDLIDDWDALGDIVADSVLMMDVLEHFKDNEMIFRRAAGLLAPGGHLCVKVPAGRAAYSDLDRASGHFRRYDRDDIDRLAAISGLDIVRVQPMNVLGALAYRLKSRTGRRSNFSSTFSERQLQVINLMIPVIRCFDVARFLPGLSWVAIYRRPSHQPD